MFAVLILAVASLGTLWVVYRHADDEVALYAASRATTVAVREALVPGVETDSPRTLSTGIPISSGVADAVSAPALLGASSGSAPIEIPASGVFSIVTSGERLELALLTADEARTLSGGGWSQGMRVTGAVTGNRLGVTSGDVIHDLCDQLGDQSPSEIVAALTANTTSCVTFVRRGGAARTSMNGPSLDE
jgi:hypothetical protein